MSPRAAGVAGATRIALKSTATASTLKLTRTPPLPPFLQTTTSSNLSERSRARTTTAQKTKTMANVQVQQQPHRQQQFQFEQHTSTSMSALQAPLPRHHHQHQQHQQQQNHIPHYSTLRRPIPNSYWATPYLLACEYPWAPSTPRPKLDALLAAGVRTFIDLTESGELLGYSQLLPLRASSCGLPPSERNTIEYFRFPIPDRSLPSSLDFLARILSVLGRCEKERRIAAVHCRGGIGRTGTVVGCWLVQSGICRDGEEALNFIAHQWATVEKHTRFPCSPETGAQADFVRNFKRLPILDREATVSNTATMAMASKHVSGTTSAVATTTTVTIASVSSAANTPTTASATSAPALAASTTDQETTVT
ncbi:hypothetical protein ACEPAF_5677 [Sanghuangporus sanghuang]